MMDRSQCKFTQRSVHHSGMKEELQYNKISATESSALLKSHKIIGILASFDKINNSCIHLGS